MARYQGRHRVATPSPARRVRLVAPPAAAAAVAITWGALATADGSPTANGAPAAEIQPLTGASAGTATDAGGATTEAAAVTAKVDAAAKSRAAARAVAVSRADATRKLNQQRATALRSLGKTTVATPYTAPTGASSTSLRAASATTGFGVGAATGYTCPIAGCGGHFTSGFGHRASPGGIGSTDHQGIDLSTPIGTPLRALHGGTVTAVGWYGGQGKRINIDIGGGVTIVYAHMSSWGVTVGQRVEVGQLVGWSGNTGNSTGPHLHLEVHLGGTPVNPVGWLRAHGIAV